jgi:hypothetical protein
LAEAEFSVVRFKCDVARPKKVYEGARPLTAEDITAKKCASPYIGEPFGENGVGGKWLIGAVLRIPLTLLGRGQGRLGGEIILLNCCKWLQINRTFYQAITQTNCPVESTSPSLMAFLMKRPTMVLNRTRLPHHLR